MVAFAARIHTRMLELRGRAGALVGLLVLSAGLSACVPLLVGGAFVGGSLIATDRRTSAAQLEDESIEVKATNWMQQLLGERAHITVTSYNRVLLATGEVLNQADKDAAERTLAKVENVRNVVNELAVMGLSSPASRANDASLSSKVKTALIQDSKDDFLANAFKVVTERGVVYLMGRVTEREAQRAVEVARTVVGVQKVVRLFEIISEDELQRLHPKSAHKPQVGRP